MSEGNDSFKVSFHLRNGHLVTARVAGVALEVLHKDLSAAMNSDIIRTISTGNIVLLREAVEGISIVRLDGSEP